MGDESDKQMSYVQALDGTEAAGHSPRSSWERFCCCCRNSLTSDEYYRQQPWPDVESRLRMEQLLVRRRWFFILSNLAGIGFIIFMTWKPSSATGEHLASLAALLFIVLMMAFYWSLHQLGNHQAESFSPYRTGGTIDSNTASAMV